MSLDGRVAVLTGATSELGLVVARSLTERGASLALLDRHADRLEALAASLALPASRVLSRTVDLLDPSAVSSSAGRIVKKFGRVEILLHLVGGWTGGKTLVEAPPDDFNFMLDQHLWTSINVIRAFIPHLVSNGWGRVVMISSPFASQPVSKGGPYAVGKAAQEALVLTLSQELAATGVTANLLVVKTIDEKRTKITAPSNENASWVTPEELAASMLYLLSDEAATVNGVRLPLYGTL